MTEPNEPPEPDPETLPAMMQDAYRKILQTVATTRQERILIAAILLDTDLEYRDAYY